MKHQTILCALLLGLASSLHAQAPGYLGKRFFAKPEFSSMYALSKTAEESNTVGGFFNTRYGLQLGYALSRRSAVTVEASYMNTGMSMSAYTPSILINGSSDEHYLFYNLGGPEIGISLQTYNPLRGSIAPMGFFTAWRLRMAFLSGDVVEDRISYAGGDASAGHQPLDISPKYNQLTVGLEFGQNIIVADRLALSFSVEFNIAPFNLNLDDSNNSSDGNQGIFDFTAAERMRWHSLFMVKVGAGYLF